MLRSRGNIRVRVRPRRVGGGSCRSARSGGRGRARASTTRRVTVELYVFGAIFTRFFNTAARLFGVVGDDDVPVGLGEHPDRVGRREVRVAEDARRPGTRAEGAVDAAVGEEAPQEILAASRRARLDQDPAVGIDRQIAGIRGRPRPELPARERAVAPPTPGKAEDRRRSPPGIADVSEQPPRPIEPKRDPCWVARAEDVRGTGRRRPHVRCASTGATSAARIVVFLPIARRKPRRSLELRRSHLSVIFSSRHLAPQTLQEIYFPLRGNATPSAIPLLRNVTVAALVPCFP